MKSSPVPPAVLAPPALRLEPRVKTGLRAGDLYMQNPRGSNDRRES